MKCSVPDQEQDQRGPGEWLCKKDCPAHKLNREDVSRWEKLIRDG